MDPIWWLAAVGVFLVLEMITLGLTTIWFAGGALVAFIVGALGGAIWIQVAMFFVVSILLLIFTRPVAEKHFNNNRQKTNIDSLIGKEGRVIEDINSFEQTGRIVVNGMEWSAISVKEKNIPENACVVIKKIEGAHVIVEKVEA